MIFLFFRIEQIIVFSTSYAIILKLQRDIKLLENIIINLLTLSLEENDSHEAENSLVC